MYKQSICVKIFYYTIIILPISPQVTMAAKSCTTCSPDNDYLLPISSKAYHSSRGNCSFEVAKAVERPREKPLAITKTNTYPPRSPLPSRRGNSTASKTSKCCGVWLRIVTKNWKQAFVMEFCCCVVCVCIRRTCKFREEFKWHRRL